MSRKHMPLLIGGAVALLLAIALFYLLFSAKGRYAEEASLLSRAQGQLRRLSSREVFPSESNVQTMGKQLGIYREYLDGLYASIREGQSADEPIDRDRVKVQFGPLVAAQDGLISPTYDEAKMSAYMKNQELEVSVDVGVGRASATMWTCDLTKQYVAINGDYRS